MQFIIPIEIKVRELESKILLLSKILSKKKNCSILFGNYKKIFNIKNLGTNLKICIDNGISYEKEKYIRLLSKNIIPVVHDEEGAVCSKHSETLKDHRGRNFKTSKFIYKILVHGKIEKDKWISQGKIEKDKIIVVGNIKFELCKPFFFNYFEKLFPIKKKIILINSAFASGNPSIDYNIFTKYLKNYKKRYKNAHNLESREKHHLYQAELFRKFFEKFKNVLNNFKDEKFILRPHPNEKSEVYEEMFKNIANIKIVKNTSVTQWLYSAKMIIHPGCATAVEGYFANVPSIFFSPQIKNEEKYYQYLPVELSDRAKNIDDLINLIKKNLIDKNKKTINNDLLEQHIYNNQSASDRFSEILSNITKKELQKFKKKFLFQIYFFNFLYKTKKIILNILGKKSIYKTNEIEKKNIRKFSGLTAEEITDKIQIHKNNLNLSFNFKIQKLDNDVYLIQN